MSIRIHYLIPFALVFAAACTENDLGVGVVDAASDIPASPGGTGGASIIGTGGTTGTVATGGRSGSGTGGTTAGTSPDGAAAGPCGEATCLTALFQTCLPAGGCVVHGGSSPSATFTTGCYANGILVGTQNSFIGDSLMVSRNGVLCYSIKTSSTVNASAVSYAVTDGNGQEIATGITADKAGHLTMTCKGGTPATVSSSCLEPVNNSMCDPGECPATGNDGGVGNDAPVADGGGAGGCDPLAATQKPITLTVLGAGKSANGTIYVADQDGSTYRVFVSDTNGTLVRQRVEGSGVTSSAAGMQYVLNVSGPASPFVVQLEVANAGATRMGVLQGVLTDRKSFVIGQDGEELTVLPSSAIASMPLRNLPASTTIEYVATLPDGQLMLVTRPTDDWAFTDFRLFLGPTAAVAERAVANVTRNRDGGSTKILFDLDGVDATAYFQVVVGDGGFVPGPATLTVGEVVTPLTRQAALPAATYLCL